MGAVTTYDLSGFGGNQTDDLQARPLADLFAGPTRRPQQPGAARHAAVPGAGQHLQRAALPPRPRLRSGQPDHRRRQRHDLGQRRRQRAEGRRRPRHHPRRHRRRHDQRRPRPGHGLFHFGNGILSSGHDILRDPGGRPERRQVGVWFGLQRPGRCHWACGSARKASMSPARTRHDHHRWGDRPAERRLPPWRFHDRRARQRRQAHTTVNFRAVPAQAHGSGERQSGNGQRHRQPALPDGRRTGPLLARLQVRRLGVPQRVGLLRGRS